MVAGIKERPLKDGSGRWAVVTLEDLSGQVEVLVFSKAYAAHEELLKRDEPVYIKGRVLMEDEPEDGGEATAKLRAEDVKSLADIRAAQARRVMIHVKAEVAEKASRTYGRPSV